MMGRALGSQRFFHDVGYENRLMDSAEELYQLEEFDYLNKPKNNTQILNNNSLDDPLLEYCDSPTTVASHGATITTNNNANQRPDNTLALLGQHTVPFPNSVITEFTWCYSSTCHGSNPCYSYSCPKRQSTKVSSI